jgi:hemerythrin-like domain-containing protein
VSAPDRLEPPLDMLAAWHRLGEDQFETLCRLAKRMPLTTVDVATCEAAYAVIFYFDKSVAVHHLDEELDLFPALIESMAGSDPVCLREMIDELTHEHRALALTWQRLRAAFAELAAGAPATIESADVEELIARCERLFRLADEELLPMADRLLSDDARDRIGATMRARHRDTRI